MKIRIISMLALICMASILTILISCEDWSKRPIIGTLSYDNLYTTEGTQGSVSPNWSSTAPSTQTMKYSISPSIAGVSIDSDNGIVTVLSTAAIMNTNFTINAEAIGNYKGSKQASTTVIVAEVIGGTPTGTPPEAASISPINTANISYNSIALSWSAPSSFGTSNGSTTATLKHYQVVYAKGDSVTVGGAASSTVTTTELTMTITGLEASTKYVFVVLATNSAGLTSTSAAVAEHTTETPTGTPPEAASISPISTANISYNSIALSWSAPSSFGTSNSSTTATLKHYQVVYAKGDSVTVGGAATSTATTTELTMTIVGLEASTKYVFVVLATNSAGLTSTSAAVAEHTTETPTGTPPEAASISPISTANISYNSIALSWSAPSSFGTSNSSTTATLKHYQVVYAKGDSVTVGGAATSTATTTELTMTIAGLEASTKYAFVVLATNSAGLTSTSAAVAEHTTETPTGTPPGAVSISPISTADNSHNSIALSWSAPSDAGKKGDGTTATITGYSVYYQVGTEVQMSTALSTTISTSTSTTITGLQGLTQYAIVVVATNSAGLTSTSATLTETTTDPNAPSTATLMPSAIANTSLGLAWVAPSDVGKEGDGTDATISSYKVFYQEGASLDYSSATKLDPSNTTASHINGREVIITGLTMNTQYTIGVRTTNSAGVTSDSNPVTLSTKHYTKLGADGIALTTQNGIWSASGNEGAGTQWSCVRDEGTGLVWEVKTNKATADAQDKDLTYKWGGLTAIGRDDTARTGTYNDEWNALVLHANDQQLTSASDDGDATEINLDSKTVLCGTSTNSGSNWRVPTLMELSTIANYNTHKPAYDATMFPNMQEGSYWSSSPDRSTMSGAWSMHFSYGSDGKLSRTNSYYVRLVRGRELEAETIKSYIANEWQDSRYTKHGDGTITDTATKLMWKQCSEGLSGNTCGAESASTHTYEDAKRLADKANAEAYANYSDWRLPTIQELRTLVAFDTHSPSINTIMFPNTQEGSYWSSSPYANYSLNAWKMHFGYGYDEDLYRTSSDYVRLVRGSQ